MQLTSTLNSIQALLTETVADFNNHLNTNTLCEQVRNGLLEIMEAFLVPAVEKVLCDPELLVELKVGAGKMGLRFNGYRPTSIRLFTGNSLTIQSLILQKPAPGNGPGANPKSGKSAPDGILGWIT